MRRLGDNLVTDPQRQEYRNADVSDDHVGDITAENCVTSLAESNDDAQHPGDDRTGRIPARPIRQLGQVVPLSLKGAPELDMSYRNTDPCDESTQTRDIDQPGVCLA